MITFYSNTLSSVDSEVLKPVLLSSLEPGLLEDFLPEIFPLISLEEHSMDSSSLLSSLSLPPILTQAMMQSLSCACGRLSDQELPCKHRICSNCASSSFCRTCNSEVPPYSQASHEYPCLCCSLIKKQRQDCPHYCLTCVRYKLKLKDSFNCFICSARFSKTSLKTLKAVCSKCSNLSQKFFELSCGCVLCQKCVLFSLKQRKCLNCEASLGLKELLKLTKHFKSRCLVCFELKSKKNFRTRCCKAKICKTCEGREESIRCCK